MKLKKIVIIFYIVSISLAFAQQETYEFAVIGAGPAGISVVVKLLQVGVDKNSIIWIDSDFGVGALGKYYGAVPSNTKVRSARYYVQECMKVIAEKKPVFALDSLPLDKPCALSFVTEPLYWITLQLLLQVKGIQGIVTNILKNDFFNICIGKNTVTAKKIFLATGSQPKKLHLLNHEVIDLEIALNPELLQKAVSKEDTIVVFGASHSAILVLKNLADLSVKKIINFYNKPLVYAIDMGSWYLNNDIGLKEEAAYWAKNILEKKKILNLERYAYSPEAVLKKIPVQAKIIYAIGFEQSVVTGLNQEVMSSYNPYTGFISPGIFGIGIAFPELRKNPFNIQEKAVGISDFMHYAEKIVPLWVASSVG